jgi:hypothetical protein
LRSCFGEPRGNVAFAEFAPGDELPERQRGQIERVVVPVGGRFGDARYLPLDRAPQVGTASTVRQGDLYGSLWRQFGGPQSVNEPRGERGRR